MSTTIVLVRGEDGRFPRDKLQELAGDQRCYISNMLDKTELLYFHLLPKKRRRLWICYFVIIFLFLGNGLYKYFSKQMNHAKVTKEREPFHGSDINSIRTPDGGDARPPTTSEPPHEMTSSDGLPQQPPRNISTTQGSGTISKPPDNRKAANCFYFLVELFLVCFPVYTCWSGWRAKKKTLLLAKGMIELENRNLVTLYQCKCELKELNIIHITLFCRDPLTAIDELHEGPYSRGLGRLTQVRVHCGPFVRE